MSSMRRLNRRLTRWQRYARHTYWNPRISRPWWMGPNTAMAYGHVQAWNAREAERERRVWDETPEIWLGGPEGETALIADVLGCDVCRLPDPYNGRGDGIGSCDCPRCDCGAPRGSALCDCPPDDDGGWDDLQETYPGSGLYE